MSGFLGIFSIFSQVMLSPAQRMLGNSVFSCLTIPPQYMDSSLIHLSLCWEMALFLEIMHTANPSSK